LKFLVNIHYNKMWVFLTQKVTSHDICETNNKDRMLFIVIDETTKFTSHMCHELPWPIVWGKSHFVVVSGKNKCFWKVLSDCTWNFFDTCRYFVQASVVSPPS
jgi:hypothetical protein